MSTPFITHVARTLSLGLPLVGAQVAQMLVNTTDTVMLGWLSTQALAAGTLATQFFFVFFIVGIGFAAAMVPLIAGAVGREDALKAADGSTADRADTTREIRRATRMGLWVLLAVSALFMVPLWYIEPILLALGQPPAVVALAGDYMIIAQWSLVPALLVMGLRQFLTGLERAGAVLWITIAVTVMNGLLDYAFIFGRWGAPAMGIEGAAIATLGSNLFAFAVAALWVTRRRGLADYAIFARFWRPDWPAFAEIVRLGWPIGLALLAEAGLFAVSSLMMGRVGTVPLAAHGIALQLASLAFMVPLGLSMAGTVRVGNAFGRGDRTAVARAGWAGIVCAVGVACVSALLFLAVPEFLVGLFLRSNPDAALVLPVAVPLLAMAAAFQLVDAGQVMAAGVLRGLKDTRAPMVIAIVAYWGLGVPAAWLFGLTLEGGGPGVWGGLVVGLSAAALALTWRFHRLADAVPAAGRPASASTAGPLARDAAPSI